MCPVAAALPEVLWPSPLPLEGVKSRKRPVFGVARACFKSEGQQSVNTISGLKLTLESRVAAIGRVGSAAPDILLGVRQLVTGGGIVSRHDNLSILHLGPHLTLLGNLEQSAEQYLVAVGDALKERPQVVILDEAAAAGNAAWSQAFSWLLNSDATWKFRGALVICVAEETPAMTQRCSHRWTGCAEWLWQEEITEDDNSWEILEDVLDAGKELVDKAMLQEVCDIAHETFNGEDLMQLAEKKGWSLTLLTTTSAAPKSSTEGYPNEDSQPNCQRRLAGYICYAMRPGGYFHIDRIAVVSGLRKSGLGRRLMRWALETTASLPRSEVAWISLSAVDTAVPFYERFGFMDMTTDEVDDDEHQQTWMEIANISNVPETVEPFA